MDLKEQRLRVVKFLVGRREEERMRVCSLGKMLGMDKGDRW